MPEPVPFPGDAVPRTPGFENALRGMRDREFCRSQKHGEQQRRAHKVGMSSILLEFEKRFVARMRKLDVPIFMAEGVRTDAEQDRKVLQGVSHVHDSAHEHGLAADIVHSRLLWSLTREQWELLVTIGEEVATQAGLPVECGHRWRKPWDPAHWQVKGWKALVGGFPFAPLAVGVRLQDVPALQGGLRGFARGG